MLAFSGRERFGHLDTDFREQVALLAAPADHRHALPTETDLTTILGEFRHAQGNASVNGRHFHFAAEQGVEIGHRNFDVEVVALPFETRMDLNRHDQVEIPVRSTAGAGTTFARDAHSRTGLYPCRDAYLKSALSPRLALSVAGVAAGIGDFASAAAGSAGLPALEANRARGTAKRFF